MADNKIYWSGLEELDRTPEFERIESQEFAAERPVDEFLSDDRLQRANTGRRDFLKFMGFSVTAATLAACETPVVKSIPYTNKPEEITPGVANFYASTYYDGHDFVNVLVKTREGRPIFVKNNTETGFGRVNGRVNASVLGLYDSARLQAPHLNGAATTWGELDAAVASGVSGSGRTGPLKVARSNDLVASALGGAMISIGDPEDPPVRLAGHQADVITATTVAAAALVALHHASRSGEGQQVDVSSLEVMAAITHIAGVGKWREDGIIPKRVGTGLVASVPSGAYACKDGLVYLMVHRPDDANARNVGARSRPHARDTLPLRNASASVENLSFNVRQKL